MRVVYCGVVRRLTTRAATPPMSSPMAGSHQAARSAARTSLNSTLPPSLGRSKSSTDTPPAIPSLVDLLSSRPQRRGGHTQEGGSLEQPPRTEVIGSAAPAQCRPAARRPCRPAPLRLPPFPGSPRHSFLYE